jgi:hypothetical protein
LENKCIQDGQLPASLSLNVAVIRRWDEERGDIVKGYKVPMFSKMNKFWKSDIEHGNYQ